MFFMTIQKLEIGTLKLEVHDSAAAAGEAAALATAEAIRQANRADGLGVIFATGNSQLETLRALTSMPDVPWEQIIGFHLDEYVGISDLHPASFRRYLRTNLTERVPIRKFFEIDGSASDLALVQREYTRHLAEVRPQICLLGIGENGHLAFNDPHEADFSDPQTIRIANLDTACRQQQVGEGWFGTLAEVPEQALTLTIPTMLRIPKLIVSVPGKRKAESVRRTFQDPISTACPATILRNHPDATLYLDPESAAELAIIA
jgi:glucosamine-6-phosphate deaminase